MSEQLVSQYALYWAIGFLGVYLLVQLLVSRHPRFQAWSAMRKSLAVKVFSLLTFVALYGLVKVTGA